MLANIARKFLLDAAKGLVASVAASLIAGASIVPPEGNLEAWLFSLYVAALTGAAGALKRWAQFDPSKTATR